MRWLIWAGSCFKRLFSAAAAATQILAHLCTGQTPWMNSQRASWLAGETSIEQVFYPLSLRNPATKAAQLFLCHCAFKWKDDLWRGLFIHVHLCWRQAPQSDSSVMLCHFNLHFGWDQSRWQLQGCCSASLSCMWATVSGKHCLTRGHCGTLSRKPRVDLTLSRGEPWITTFDKVWKWSETRGLSVEMKWKVL